MSLPDQRYRAIAMTRVFLENLANPQGLARIPEKVRKDAKALLNHYPDKFDLDRISAVCPNILQENIEPVTRLIMQYEESRSNRHEA